MQMTCSHCGEIAQTDVEVAVGQHVICPSCGLKFTYDGEAEIRSSGVTCGESVDRKFMLEAPCPHCGTFQTFARSEFGRFVECAECGEGFIVGQKGERPKDKIVENADGVHQAIATMAAIGRSVTDRFEDVEWRQHGKRIGRVVAGAAKYVKGTIEEIDREKHGAQTKRIVRKGMEASGDVFGNVCKFMSSNSQAWLNASRNVGTIDVECPKPKLAEKNEGCQKESEEECRANVVGGQVPEAVGLPNKMTMLWVAVGVGAFIAVITILCMCRDDDNRWTAEDQRNYEESQRMEMHRWYQKLIMKSRL